jgi:hypothetical protein
MLAGKKLEEFRARLEPSIRKSFRRLAQETGV